MKITLTIENLSESVRFVIETVETECIQKDVVDEAPNASRDNSNSDTPVSMPIPEYNAEAARIAVEHALWNSGRQLD